CRSGEKSFVGNGELPSSGNWERAGAFYHSCIIWNRFRKNRGLDKPGELGSFFQFSLFIVHARIPVLEGWSEFTLEHTRRESRKGRFSRISLSKHVHAFLAGR